MSVPIPRNAAFLVLAAPLLLGACASHEAPASSNVSAVDTANAKADKAIETAQQALQTAQKAEQEAQAANQRADTMYNRTLKK